MAAYTMDSPDPAPSPATAARAVEERLALAYTPAAARAGMRALFDLDRRLGSIPQTTREPMVGQMRLTWWHDALSRLGADIPPAEPVLAAVAAEGLPRGVEGGALAGMVDGWEVLLGDDALRDDDLSAYAVARGAGLFRALGRVVGAGGADPLEAAGAGWALFDLARHVRDPGLAARADALARSRIAEAFGRRWSRPARGLGAMLLIAAARDPGPRLVARLLWHRSTGR